jgi:predicted transcriptional regulator
MEDGRLVAIPGKRSASMGTARTDAKAGEEIMIGNLEGVVEMELGSLLMLQLPSEGSGGSRSIDVSLASKAVKSSMKGEVAVGDIIGEVAAGKLRLKPTLVHAPVEASLNALSKGVNVIFLGAHESSEEMVRAVERLKEQTGYSIHYRIVDVGI